MYSYVSLLYNNLNLKMHGTLWYFTVCQIKTFRYLPSSIISTVLIVRSKHLISFRRVFPGSAWKTSYFSIFCRWYLLINLCTQLLSKTFIVTEYANRETLANANMSGSQSQFGIFKCDKFSSMILEPSFIRWCPQRCEPLLMFEII